MPLEIIDESEIVEDNTTDYIRKNNISKLNINNNSCIIPSCTDKINNFNQNSKIIKKNFKYLNKFNILDITDKTINKDYNKEYNDIMNYNINSILEHNLSHMEIAENLNTTIDFNNFKQFIRRINNLLKNEEEKNLLIKEEIRQTDISKKMYYL